MKEPKRRISIFPSTGSLSPPHNIVCILLLGLASRDKRYLHLSTPLNCECWARENSSVGRPPSIRLATTQPSTPHSLTIEFGVKTHRFPNHLNHRVSIATAHTFIFSPSPCAAGRFFTFSHTATILFVCATGPDLRFDRPHSEPFSTPKVDDRAPQQPKRKRKEFGFRVTRFPL